MPNQVIYFKVNVAVPAWGYCNTQKDANNKDDTFCNFHIGEQDKRKCSLFSKYLYSSYSWVKKCDECLSAVE